MMKTYKSIVVELDLSKLDDSINSLDQIKSIQVSYDNVGEDAEWTEAVEFKIKDAVEK